MKSYLDNSASTKVDPEVAKAMWPYFVEFYGNPSSRHDDGRAAHEAIEKARERVAALINAKPEEIVFTSGGTESDNLAIRGVARQVDNIFHSNIEHAAILKTCAEFGTEKRVESLNVDGEGLLDPNLVANIVKKAEGKSLVSVMLANNEIGTIQPVGEIKALLPDGTILHTDAVQAIAKVPIDVRKLDVDLLSIASHKFHGPKGVGALFVKEGTKLTSIQTGGSHEMGLRAGTENVPGIVGMGLATEIARTHLEEHIKYMTRLRDELIHGLLGVEKSALNGNGHWRLPNNVNMRFLGVEGDQLVDELNANGISASTGSACSTKRLNTSHVLMALGVPEWELQGSLRLTLSRYTTREEIKYAKEKIPEAVSMLRETSPLWWRIEKGEKIPDNYSVGQKKTAEKSPR